MAIPTESTLVTSWYVNVPAIDTWLNVDVPAVLIPGIPAPVISPSNLVAVIIPEDFILPVKIWSVVFKLTLPVLP